MKFQIGDRAIHNAFLKEGTIDGYWRHRYQGNLWFLSFDDGGMDDEFFEEDMLDFISRDNEAKCTCGHTRSNHGCMKDDGCDEFAEAK